MKTEKIKISKIKRNPNNPRLIKDNKFHKLVKSIKEFPEMLDIRPIVVNEEMIVLGGNMRLKACQEAGLKEIPVIKASELSENQQREFIVKDNVGFGEWDWDMIANEWDMDKLDEWGLDMPVDFKVEEAESEEDDYTEPDNLKVDVVLGDLIEIGEHRLLCGDSTDSDQVAKLMNGAEPDWIYTDPPYGMNAVSKSGVLSKNYDSDIMGDDNPDIAKDSFNLIYSLYPNTKQVWWGANYYSSSLPDSECWLVWDKNNGGSDQTDAELAWCNYRSVVRKFTKSSEKTNRVHPTQKPLELVQWCYEWSKIKINIVADFFGGSGVTMVWSEQMNKKSFLMELDPKYCQVIIDRMQKLDDKLEVKINGKSYGK
jgi:DNA modification methylase